MGCGSALSEAPVPLTDHGHRITLAAGRDGDRSGSGAGPCCGLFLARALGPGLILP